MISISKLYAIDLLLMTIALLSAVVVIGCVTVAVVAAVVFAKRKQLICSGKAEQCQTSQWAIPFNKDTPHRRRFLYFYS